MKAWEDKERAVWSCRLCEPPQEGEAGRLEEELRRRQPDFVGDALTLRRYLLLTGCSQEECARRIGRSQSSVANRLRLLKLPEDVLAALRRSSLTERHGRALLRLPDPALQRAALEAFLRRNMSVSEAEAHVDGLTARGAPAPPLRCGAVKDEGLLLNTLHRDLDTLRRCGLRAEEERRETETELVLTIRIGKKGDAGKK